MKTALLEPIPGRAPACSRCRTEFVPLGQGIVPLNQVAAVLKEIGFRGPIESQSEYADGMGGRTSLSVPRERFTQAMRQDAQLLRQPFTAVGNEMSPSPPSR